MTRRATAGLLAVAVLLALAVAAGLAGVGSRPAKVSARSSLADCPTALSPDLPSLRLDCLGGGPRVNVTRRASGPGVPRLVNVWATWCPPCIREVPYLVAFQAKLAGQLSLVGVLTEDSQEHGLRFAADFGMRYPSVVDPDGAIMRAFPPGPPTTLFVDATGHVVFRHGGQFHSEAEIERLVLEHLGVRV